VLVSIVLEVPSARVLLWIARRAARRFFMTHFNDDELRSLPVRKVPLTPRRDA
jgi:hypothetical protein